MCPTHEPVEDAPVSSDRADIKGLEAKLGYTFNDRALLERATVHSSSANASEETRRFVENVAWLGDSVLYVILSEEVYREFCNGAKQILHEKREEFKTNVALGATAETLHMARHISTGSALEQNPAATDRHEMLATHFEAMIGAAYLDGGLPAARAIVRVMLESKGP